MELNFVNEFLFHLLYLWFVKIAWKYIFERISSFLSVNTFNASFTFIFAFEELLTDSQCQVKIVVLLCPSLYIRPLVANQNVETEEWINDGRKEGMEEIQNWNRPIPSRCTQTLYIEMLTVICCNYRYDSCLEMKTGVHLQSFIHFGSAFDTCRRSFRTHFPSFVTIIVVFVMQIF